MLEDSSVDRFTDVFLKDYALAPSTFDEYLQYVAVRTLFRLRLPSAFTQIPIRLTYRPSTSC